MRYASNFAYLYVKGPKFVLKSCIVIIQTSLHHSSLSISIEQGYVDTYTNASSIWNKNVKILYTE